MVIESTVYVVDDGMSIHLWACSPRKMLQFLYSALLPPCLFFKAKGLPDSDPIYV